MPLHRRSQPAGATKTRRGEARRGDRASASMERSIGSTAELATAALPPELRWRRVGRGHGLPLKVRSRPALRLRLRPQPAAKCRREPRQLAQGARGTDSAPVSTGGGRSSRTRPQAYQSNIFFSSDVPDGVSTDCARAPSARAGVHGSGSGTRAGPGPTANGALSAVRRWQRRAFGPRMRPHSCAASVGGGAPADGGSQPAHSTHRPHTQCGSCARERTSMSGDSRWPGVLPPAA